MGNKINSAGPSYGMSLRKRRIWYADEKPNEEQPNDSELEGTTPVTSNATPEEEGQKVADLVNGELPAGNHSVNFNASSLSSGVYIYQLRAGSFVQTKKLVLMK